MQSAKGHNFMRKFGPFVVCMFFATQLLHAFLFFTVFGPALQEKLVDYGPLAGIMQVIGWFFFYRVTYLYYRVTSSSPGIPSKDLNQRVKEGEVVPNPDLPVDQDLVKTYSKDMGELKRYTQIADNDIEIFENALSQLPEEERTVCAKCKYVKPLRTHHCSVCNQCVQLMDHHCMWTNNCIGLNNYKNFIQLCGHGCWAALFTVLVISLTEDMDVIKKSEWVGFFYFCKLWDLLIGKVMMAFFGWNFYVATSGLTFLEYKSVLEERAKAINLKAQGKLEPTGLKNFDEKRRNLLKFNYGFATWQENIARVLKTNNFVLGLLFIDWFEDPRLRFNGTEWSSFYYYSKICEVSDGAYATQEYKDAMHEREVNQM